MDLPRVQSFGVLGGKQDLAQHNTALRTILCSPPKHTHTHTIPLKAATKDRGRGRGWGPGGGSRLQRGEAVASRRAALRCGFIGAGRRTPLGSGAAPGREGSHLERPAGE